MAEPVVYVSTWKIKDGKFDEYLRFYAKQLKIIDEAEPQIIAFLAFANEDGTEMTHVHVHPDRASMDKHMGVLAEKMGVLADDLSAVYQFMEPVRTEVFGTPGDRAMEMDKQLIDAGVPFTQAATYRRLYPLRLIGLFGRAGTRGIRTPAGGIVFEPMKVSGSARVLGTPIRGSAAGLLT